MLYRILWLFKFTISDKWHYTWCSLITGPPSFERYNLVNIQFEQQTLSQEGKPIIVQPNIEPTFLYKFHQFYTFIWSLLYDSNLGDPGI